MSTVWARKDKNQPWKPASPFWQQIPEERAHNIADHYNTKYSHAMWWVTKNGEKPPENAEP